MLVEQADSRRDSRQSRRRVIAPGPLRRWRSGSGGADLCGGAGFCGKNPGLTHARLGVHSADINGLGVSVLSGDRWNSAVSLRRAAPVHS